MDLRPLILLVLLAACERPSNSGSASGVPVSIRYPDIVAAGGSQPPAGELNNPYKGDSASAREGGKIFGSMNCDGCHGAGATGWVGPSLVDGRWRYGGTDGALYQSIFYGRPRGMPAFGGVMSPGAIWKIVTYINSQPVPSVVPTQRWDSGGQSRPVREQTP